jgi:hypothetical protein
MLHRSLGIVSCRKRFWRLTRTSHSSGKRQYIVFDTPASATLEKAGTWVRWTVAMRSIGYHWIFSTGIHRSGIKREGQTFPGRVLGHDAVRAYS